MLPSYCWRAALLGRKMTFNYYSRSLKNMKRGLFVLLSTFSYLSLNCRKANRDLVAQGTCFHTNANIYPVLLAGRPCTGAAHHEGGGWTTLSGRPVERSGLKPISVPGWGRGGCGGRPPADPQVPAGPDSHWKGPRLQLVSEDTPLSGNPE